MQTNGCGWIPAQSYLHKQAAGRISLQDAVRWLVLQNFPVAVSCCVSQILTSLIFYESSVSIFKIRILYTLSTMKHCHKGQRRWWLYKSLENFKVVYISIFLSLPSHPEPYFPIALSTKSTHINTPSQREIITGYFVFTTGLNFKCWLPKMSPKLPVIAQSWVCSYQDKEELALIEL